MRAILSRAEASRAGNATAGVRARPPGSRGGPPTRSSVARATKESIIADAHSKLIQYLGEAHATEVGLTRVLQSQIAMTPRGRYRRALEAHLDETRSHAERVRVRMREIGPGRNPLQTGLGAAETVVGQLLAAAKTPLDMVRGTGGQEKVLKNAKDACATEALEIATYTAIAGLARSAGDAETADLADSIRAEEQRMLERILGLLPGLAGGVEDDDSSFDIGTTGAAEAAKRTARQARKVPGVAQAEGQVKGAVADESDLPIANYHDLKADEVVSRLKELSQIDLAKVDSYERRHANRATVKRRLDSLRGDEPWPGYDEQNADEIDSALRAVGDDTVREVASYERSHKDRAGVLRATERDTSAR